MERERIKAALHEVMNAVISLAPDSPANIRRDLFELQRLANFIILNEEALEGLIQTLKCQDELSLFDNTMFNVAGGGATVSLRHLALWLAIVSHFYGTDRAIEDLVSYLITPFNAGFEILLLSGVCIRARLVFNENLWLEPIQDLSPFMLRTIFHHPYGHSVGLREAQTHVQALQRLGGPLYQDLDMCLPSAALVRRATFEPKTWGPDERPQRRTRRDPDGVGELDEICWTLACIASCWPQPLARYNALAPEVPCAYMLGSGSSYPANFETYGPNPAPMTDDDMAHAKRVVIAFCRLNNKRRKEIRAACEWLSFSKRRKDKRQKYIDTAIVLEALFGDKEQIAMTIRTRCSWLLGKDAQDRRRIHCLVNSVYGNRSKVVHGAKETKDDGSLHETVTLCERAIAELIVRGEEPDWTSLVLGG